MPRTPIATTEAPNGVLTADSCMAPGPNGQLCDGQAFHGGRHTWDEPPADELGQEACPASNLLIGTGCTLAQGHDGPHDWGVWGTEADAEPEPAPAADGYGTGAFEMAADVKAVRGKNTSDGPALEIVLDAAIDSHVADVMALIGKSATRVIFRPYAVQSKLPEPEPEEPSADELES